MKSGGQIDFSRFRLIKATLKDAKVIVDFEAPRMAGQTYEPWRSTSNTQYNQPHADFWAAWIPVRNIVLRLFEWPKSKAEQVSVTGIELEHSGEDVFEVMFRFVFTNSSLATQIEISKTVPLTSITGILHSLTEKEIDAVANLVDEVQAYVSREKGATGDLFKHKAVAEINVN